ncbi:Kv channel-interacting protein 1 isoform X4 [Lingula anatina]|uniref:Kv channel-interacting protein 1 isoform X4 n=1 Tax=Lingula anatina TaxID=7574 RepID=A0A1S3I2M1_LINAN|nr:Kv channel-interacting protein 1 isoform X4 [Lingula anatina]|eukprot:XP_013392493.1 Kv channel-interacting protein 1 isoform X4 [Lingula anatina]
MYTHGANHTSEEALPLETQYAHFQEPWTFRGMLIKFCQHCIIDCVVSCFCKQDNDLDDLEMQVVRYKPEGLDALCRNTKFSRKELQIMYRGFKQVAVTVGLSVSQKENQKECPTGIVNEETFKEIYAQFFPQGESSQYAHYVFSTFDRDNNGSISFEEFVVGLSVLSRGSLQEKLQWAFSLYDINNDGVISKDEMTSIITAIYDLMGRCSEPFVDENTIRDHVDRVFQKMDLNKDGFISMDEFMEACRGDKDVVDDLVKKLTSSLIAMPAKIPATLPHKMRVYRSL